MADRYPLIVDSTNENIKELPSGDSLLFLDNEKIKVGTGSDLTLYHDASNSYITNAVGALKVATETSGIAVTIGHTTSETTIADNLTVTGTLTGTLATAAQGSVTSLGTLTALTVDDVAINGKVVTMTGSSGDTAAITVGTNGTLSIVTVDTAAAAANIQVTADGTVDIDSVGVLTLDSGAAINIEPAAGSAILLDGTISVDAGVVTGATSITSTAFVGTLSTAAQANVTSLGTLTALTVDNVAINGTTIGHTGDTDLMTVASGVLTVAGEVDATSLDISGDADIDGTTNLDNTDIDGSLTVDGAIDLNATTLDIDASDDIDIDTSDTTGGIAIGTANSGVPVSIGHSTSEVTVGDNLTITGDLTVSGTTTTVNSTTVSIADPVFELGVSGSDDNLDRGIKMKYNSSGAKIAFMGYDDSDGKFAFIPDATDSSSVFSGSIGILKANLEGDVTGDITGDVAGDVTGNADTATALATARTIGGTSFDGTANIAVATATVGTNVTASANNSTNETVYPTFVDGATGTQGIETDTGLTYNPSTGTLTSTVLVGALTGNVTGNVDTFTASANNSTNETVYPVFVDGATGSQGAETDTGLTYNPSTGMLTTTGVTATFTGNITGNVTGDVTGDVTGNASGTAATVTGATQAAITSAANLATVGTITSGTWQGTTIAVNQGGTGLTSSGTSGFIPVSNGSGFVMQAIDGGTYS